VTMVEEQPAPAPAAGPSRTLPSYLLQHAAERSTAVALR
jgi:hypothetical protein